MDERRQRYWDLLDFSVGHGLEVGPLHRAMVTRAEGDVSYVDVTDRDRLVEHYSTDPSVPADAIPEIDFWLIDEGGATRTLVEATAAGAPFDWVMASHVIEHVPNIIGWLDELAQIVVDGGRLVLAVPDRRYEFDVHRPASTVGQMLQAHYAEDQRPAVAAVYDHFSSAVHYDPTGVWEGRLPTFEDRIHTFEQARDMVARTLAGEYVDSHVWLFTPESFVHQLHELRQAGLSGWVVEKINPTLLHNLEFQVVLRRLPRAGDATADVPDEVLPLTTRPTWLADHVAAPEPDADTAALQRRVERLEARLARKNDALRRLRRRVRRQARKLARFRDQADATAGATIGERARARVRALRNGR